MVYNQHWEMFSCCSSATPFFCVIIACALGAGDLGVEQTSEGPDADTRPSKRGPTVKMRTAGKMMTRMSWKEVAVRFSGDG
jgi:hypothetical protein